MLCRSSLPVCSCFFILSAGSSAEQTILMKSSLSNFPFMSHTFGVKWKNPCLALDPEDFLLCFFPKSFMFCIEICYPFWVHFEYGVRLGQSSLSLLWTGARTPVPTLALFAEKAVCPPLNCFHHCQKAVEWILWVYFWFFLPFHWSKYLSLCQHCTTWLLWLHN